MTIYQTRYRDLKEASMRRAGGDARRGRSPLHQIERRFAPRKLEIDIDCFELNPGMSDLCDFSMSPQQIEPCAVAPRHGAPLEAVF